MKQINPWAGFVPVLGLMLLLVSGVAAQVPGHKISDMVRDENNTTGYTFCTVAIPHSGGKTDTYYSDVFLSSKESLHAANDAFLQFLRGKYSLQLPPQDNTCENLFSARQADAQSRLDRTERTNSDFVRVTKTGWVYSDAAKPKP